MREFVERRRSGPESVAATGPFPPDALPRLERRRNFGKILRESP